MASMTFYARGDGSSANNAALNVDSKAQQPTTLVTFESGPTGDIILEANGGAADPDTTVTINGESYNFILEQTGNLPPNNRKVPDVLEGKEVTVISVIIDGKYERLFFVSDGSGTFALMEQFGNGAIPLTNVNTAPTSVYICFCEQTNILTPTGYSAVETLATGDLVQTASGQAAPILWIGRSETTMADMRDDPARRPVRIRGDLLGSDPDQPDLYVSAQHRIVMQGPWVELYFGEPMAMVRARHLVGSFGSWHEPKSSVTYYHILLKKHDILIANSIPVESFQPSLRTFNNIAADMRASLFSTIEPSQLYDMFHRPDAMLTLKRQEAEVLLDTLFAGTLSKSDRRDVGPALAA